MNRPVPNPGGDAPVQRQRVSARALLRRADEVLLARVSSSSATAPGVWTLPGGGVDHGEHPEESLRREVYEETGLEIDVGPVRAVVSRHFTGLSPCGVLEDFHGIHLVYDASVTSQSDEPRVVEVDGTTDAVGWFSVAEVLSPGFRTSSVVRQMLDRPGPLARTGESPPAR